MSGKNGSNSTLLKILVAVSSALWALSFGLGFWVLNNQTAMIERLERRLTRHEESKDSHVDATWKDRVRELFKGGVK